jgi:hypothetical protein
MAQREYTLTCRTHVNRLAIFMLPTHFAYRIESTHAARVFADVNSNRTKFTPQYRDCRSLSLYRLTDCRATRDPLGFQSVRRSVTHFFHRLIHVKSCSPGIATRSRSTFLSANCEHSSLRLSLRTSHFACYWARAVGPTPPEERAVKARDASLV